MTDISKLNKSELKSLLKDLKLYSSLRKDLGNRGVTEYNKIKNGIPVLKVEYYSDVSPEDYKRISSDIFKKTFSIDNPENVEYIEKRELGGGIRVFKNDNMIDLSFKKIENKLKK